MHEEALRTLRILEKRLAEKENLVQQLKDQLRSCILPVSREKIWIYKKSDISPTPMSKGHRILGLLLRIGILDIDRNCTIKSSLLRAALIDTTGDILFSKSEQHNENTFNSTYLHFIVKSDQEMITSEVVQTEHISDEIYQILKYGNRIICLLENGLFSISGLNYLKCRSKRMFKTFYRPKKKGWINHSFSRCAVLYRAILFFIYAETERFSNSASRTIWVLIERQNSLEISFPALSLSTTSALAATSWLA